MQPWIFTVVSLLIGFSLGLIFSRLFPAGKEEKIALEEKLKEKEEELAKYQSDVSTHFAKTADLVNNLTDSYKAVHQHLASGVQNLCPENTGERLVHTPAPQLESNTTAPSENPDIVETTSAQQTETNELNETKQTEKESDFEPPWDYDQQAQAKAEETTESAAKEEAEQAKSEKTEETSAA